jgi:hypothetical protein
MKLTPEQTTYLRWCVKEIKEMNTVLSDTCWTCNAPCSEFSEYQDDGRVFCSLDCLNEESEE